MQRKPGSLPRRVKAGYDYAVDNFAGNSVEQAACQPPAADIYFVEIHRRGSADSTASARTSKWTTSITACGSIQRNLAPLSPHVCAQLRSSWPWSCQHIREWPCSHCTGCSTRERLRRHHFRVTHQADPYTERSGSPEESPDTKCLGTPVLRDF